MSDNLLSYQIGATGLWEHDEGAPVNDPDHDFEGRKGDLFTVMEYSEITTSPPYDLYDYKSLRDIFPDILEEEYIISCHRIRQENEEFVYTHYLFFKFKDIPLPVGSHTSSNVPHKTYLHVLSNSENDKTKFIDSLRCLTLAMSGAADSFESKISDLLELIKEFDQEQQLIDEVNRVLEPYDEMLPLWICRPPN